MNGKNRQNSITRGFRKQNRLMRVSMMIAFALLLMLMLAGTAFAAESADDGDISNEESVYMESDAEDGFADEQAETADSALSARDDESADPENNGSGSNEEGEKGRTPSGEDEAETGANGDGDAARTDEKGAADETGDAAGQNDEGKDEEDSSGDSVETKVTTTAAKTGGLSNLGTPKTGDSFPLVCILIFAASLTLIGIVACRVLQRRRMVS